MEKLVARLALLLVALLSISCSRPSEAFDEISWQGEKYRLSRTFESWEDYKKASEQLAAHERARVYAKAISIPVPQSFQSHEALVHGMPELSFPGYGSESDGTVKEANGIRYTLLQFPIPESGKRRAVLYRAEHDGSYTLVMDQVFEDLPSEQSPEFYVNRSTTVENGVLRVYVKGKVHREAKLNMNDRADR